MRISLFLNNDLESNIALNCLLPTLSSHQYNIYLSEKVGKESTIPPLRQLAFLEREFPNKHLFPQLELMSANGFLSFDQVNKKHGVSITPIDSLNASLEEISAFKPDLFISIRFGKIFKGEVLSIPTQGIINLHSAILPDYKGVLGTFRALLNGDDKIGSTLHYITDSGIDTGKIIGVSKLNVTPGKSVLWHIVNLYPQACEKLSTLINTIDNRKTIQSIQQTGDGNYYTFPTQEEFDQLKDVKIELFNLNEYASLLEDFFSIDPAWVKEKLNNEDILKL
jgi:methionyl-tRNA formyltransferase